MKKHKLWYIKLSKVGIHNYKQSQQAMHLFSGLIKLELFKTQKQLDSAVDLFADSCKVYTFYNKGK